jgi:hypothetical protein
MDLNNSFPNYAIDQMQMQIDERLLFNTANANTYDEKINSSFREINKLKLFDDEINRDQNFNLSPALNKKKCSLDISYSIGQTFYENSNMNIDDEFQNEETCKKNIYIFRQLNIIK